MAVRKQCKGKGCKDDRCEHPLWFDVMHDGVRYRMKVEEFVLPRLRDGQTSKITVKQAEKIWEPVFRAEILAGRDPRRPRKQNPNVATVRDLLDRYEQLHVEPEGKRSIASIRSRLKVLRERLGDLPVRVLEKPDDIMAFKASYRKERNIATVNRVLSLLRHVVNWARFQDPPILTTTPFHRFGVTIRSKEETKRDRRISADEERRLLAACATMNSPEHRWVGALMHDRIIGALESCCRLGEMLKVQNRDVDWDSAQIAIPSRNAKDGDNKRIPFDPEGRLAAVLKRRKELGPNAYVFGTESGTFQASIKTAWHSVLLTANGISTKRSKHGGRVDAAKVKAIDLHWHDLRHEGACRLLADRVDVRTIQLMLGHSDIKQTQTYLNITDEELRRSMQGTWERRRLLHAVEKAS